MRRLRALLARLGGLFGRERRERELTEELNAHVALHIQDNLRAGMSAEEARRKALLRLGGIEQTKEIYRERRGLPLLETLWQDLRFAARMLRKNPGFTTVAVFTLALGIGANTAIFSIVNAVILRPLPYKDASRIVALNTKAAMFPAFSLGLSWPALQEIRAHASSLEQLVACWEESRTLTRAGDPAVLNAAQVSQGFFEEFGVRPSQGRLLTDEDDKSGDHVLVISDKLWRSRFAGDPRTVGRSLTLDHQEYTVVGVAARGFAFPEKTDIWLPLTLTAENKQSSVFFRLGAFGKLRKGLTLQALRTELAAITPRLSEQSAKDHPDLTGGFQISAETLLNHSVEDARTGYLVLLAAATLVLLIACANLANLLLARGWGRQREMAVRAALGASPSRLRRQCLVESCLLALVGGLLGTALAAAGVQVFRVIAPTDAARLSEVSADWTLLWFALASSLVSGVLFGLAPAGRAARLARNDALKEGSGRNITGRSRFGGALVVVEVALAFILLVGSTLMVQTLAHLLRQDPGFRTDHLLTFDLPQTAVPSKQESDRRAASQIPRLQQVLADIRALPGVEDVAASDHVVLGGTISSNAGLRLEGALPGSASIGEGVAERLVSAGYFRMLGVPVMRGREFDDHDLRNGQRVVIVNEKMARKYWGTLDIVGRRMSVSKDDHGNPEWNEIVGVTANARDAMVQFEPEPEFFLSLFQKSADLDCIIVRTREDADALAHTISRRVWASDPDQPVTHISSMTATIAESVGDQRLHTTLLGIFAAIGLTLALLGVYGVISYSVVRRTQEIGVRMALGAGRSEVLRMVLGQGLTLVAIGAAIGTAGALGAVRVIASELYGVKPSDPWTYAGGITLILLVGCVACWVPARRAMGVDPMVALRHD